MELVKPSRGSRVFGSHGATAFELWKCDQCEKKIYIYIYIFRVIECWCGEGTSGVTIGMMGVGKVGNNE